MSNSLVKTILCFNIIADLSQVVLGISRTKRILSGSQLTRHPMEFVVGNEPIGRQQCKRDVDAANIPKFGQHGCGKQAESASI
mmetsp:Transcript_65460/g.106091  ORF Transcript_65460/g.106091 Transcript_65460/m.106091 type:complete len:83 (+) Transcript_65460:191-439(+)